MTDEKTKISVKGQCLCGAVTFTAENTDTGVGACHCDMCRKWSGGPLLAVDCGTDVVFQGAENISIYSSSEWAERGFCKLCGSNLFYRLKTTGQHIVCAGALDSEAQLVLDHQVFVDEKPDYYNFEGADKLHNMTGAEVFAMFGPGG